MIKTCVFVNYNDAESKNQWRWLRCWLRFCNFILVISWKKSTQYQILTPFCVWRSEWPTCSPQDLQLPPLPLDLLPQVRRFLLVTGYDSVHDLGDLLRGGRESLPDKSSQNLRFGHVFCSHDGSFHFEANTYYSLAVCFWAERVSGFRPSINVVGAETDVRKKFRFFLFDVFYDIYTFCVIKWEIRIELHKYKSNKCIYNVLKYVVRIQIELVIHFPFPLQSNRTFKIFDLL